MVRTKKKKKTAEELGKQNGYNTDEKGEKKSQEHSTFTTSYVMSP